MFGIAILSAVVCLLIDTMAGILIGAVVSLLLFVDQMSRGHSEIHLNKGRRVLSYLNIAELDKKKSISSSPLPKQEIEMSSDTLPLTPEGVPESEEFGDTLVYRITGQLTFVNGIAHVQRMGYIADSTIKNVVISLRYLYYVDLDGIDALQDMVEKLHAKDTKVLFTGVLDVNVKAALEKHKFYQEIKHQGLVFPSYIEALAFLQPAGKEEQPNQFRKDDLLDSRENY
jgi:MFS superfamily sulfate permease-like transporter